MVCFACIHGAASHCCLWALAWKERGWMLGGMGTRREAACLPVCLMGRRTHYTEASSCSSSSSSSRGERGEGRTGLDESGIRRVSRSTQWRWMDAVIVRRVEGVRVKGGRAVSGSKSSLHPSANHASCNVLSDREQHRSVWQRGFS